MQCPLHPEWSAPCSVNRILAAMYGIFLIFVIILAIVSARKLRKVKKQIENEFLEATKQS
jgi:preprotein translocase subunit SecG